VCRKEEGAELRQRELRERWGYDVKKRCCESSGEKADEQQAVEIALVRRSRGGT
jgi:hypothetical protein